MLSGILLVVMLVFLVEACAKLGPAQEGKH